jgi:hypothetical protein
LEVVAGPCAAISYFILFLASLANSQRSFDFAQDDKKPRGENDRRRKDRLEVVAAFGNRGIGIPANGFLFIGWKPMPL